MQAVGERIEAARLAWIRWIEDIAYAVFDPTDAGIACLERGIVGDAGRTLIRWLCARGVRGPAEGYGDDQPGGREARREPQGMSTVEPVVRRASRSRCASAASASGYR